ncbi:MAG TPA: hypothetical protein VFO58_25215 [Vicinamibacterales bacterium]|nr:hypothetical protein [Vicinamibacterales bacterium]
MISRPRRQPVTLEAVGAIAILVAVAASYFFLYTWPSIAPLVYQVAPGFRATKTGPEGFPVVVRINQSSLRITNGSEVRWTCAVWLPPAPVFSAGVRLAPTESRDLPYESFTGQSGTLTDGTGYTGRGGRLKSTASRTRGAGIAPDSFERSQRSLLTPDC